MDIEAIKLNQDAVCRIFALKSFKYQCNVVVVKKAKELRTV